MTRSIRFIVCLALLSASVAQAEVSGVSGWRTAPMAHPDSKAPADWADAGNVLWEAPMPGWSNSTPVVHGDTVYTQAEPDTLLAVDANTGVIRWQRRTTLQEALGEPGFSEAEMTVFNQKKAERDTLQQEARQLGRAARNDPAVRAQVDELRGRIAELDKVLEPLDRFSPPITHETNGYTSPTPVTDGEMVYAVLGSGVVVAYDAAGERRWARHIQKPPNDWGQSASPLLVGDTLVVLFDDMIGLNPADGGEKWRVPGQFTFGSPVVAMVGDRPVIVTPTAAFVDPADGKVLGKVSNVKLEFNTPLVDGTRVYFIYGKAIAVDLSRQGDGTIAAATLWEQTLPDDRYYASPLLHDGLIYAVTRGEQVTILNASDGAIRQSARLPGGGGGGNARGGGNSAYPSPILVNDKVYFGTESGRVGVFEPGAEGTPAGMMQVEPFRGTPIVVGDRLYLRTTTKLVCVGKPQQAARAE